MLAGIRKNIQTGSLNYVIGLLVFLLLILGAGQDFFHNHKPDFEHHDDCPAFHLYLLFSSTIIFNCVYWFILLLLIILNLICCISDYLFFQKTYNSRAPPFQISKNLGSNSKRN
jgi:hypothetical protein